MVNWLARLSIHGNIYIDMDGIINELSLSPKKLDFLNVMYIVHIMIVFLVNFIINILKIYYVGYLYTYQHYSTCT